MLIDTPYGKKNWEMIKHCLDNHDRLLEALKSALYVIDELSQDILTEDNEFLEQIAIINVAIEEAEKN